MNIFVYQHPCDKSPKQGFLFVLICFCFCFLFYFIMCMWVHISWHAYRHQKTASCNWFSSSTFRWVPDIKLRLPPTEPPCQPCICILRQDLALQPRMSSNSQSCLSFLNAGVTGMQHHTQLAYMLLNIKLTLENPTKVIFSILYNFLNVELI